MSISRQNLSAVIVTFKSDKVIDDCIKSIPDEIKIIVVDNSNDKKLKENIEKKYKNVDCILSSSNLGMGAGNNCGLKHVKTDYAIVLNPDIILEKNSIDEIINQSQKIESFAVLAPISDDTKYPNYKKNKQYTSSSKQDLPFEVSCVDGYAMCFNLKRINQHQGFENCNFFDENIFMYLENDDFCKRLIDKKEKIFVIPTSKVKHLGGRAVNEKYNHEIELSRNWHWIWSKFYFQRKHSNYFIALIDSFPTFFSAILKYIFYLIIFNSKERDIYLHRALGYLNAALGKKSFLRPNIKD